MNIPEILVANGTGAVLVSFLLLLRVRGESKNSVGTELFCRILVVTLLAQATETLSFLLDGVPGAASRFWLYLTNTICTGATVCVGYAWCLYVDFRVYRSTGRLRRRHLLLGAPLLALLVLLVANLFGTGWIFSISADNAYHRGPLNVLLYLLLFSYYAESVWQVHKAKRDGITVEFFSGVLLRGHLCGGHAAAGRILRHGLWLAVGSYRLCACGQPDPQPARLYR